MGRNADQSMPSGTFKPITMMVMMMASTPSLNASKRLVPTIAPLEYSLHEQSIKSEAEAIGLLSSHKLSKNIGGEGWKDEPRMWHLDKTSGISGL